MKSRVRIASVKKSFIKKYRDHTHVLTGIISEGYPKYSQAYGSVIIEGRSKLHQVSNTTGDSFGIMNTNFASGNFSTLNARSQKTSEMVSLNALCSTTW